MTSTLAFEGEGKIREYVGGYQDWLRQRPKLNAKKAVSEAVKEVEPLAKEPTVESKKPLKLSYKLQRELDMLPGQLEEAESALEAQQAICAAEDFYQLPHDKVTAELAKLETLEQQVESLMERWVELEAMTEA